MLTYNNGSSEDEIVQNRFTAYISQAVRRRKKEYVEQLSKCHEIVGLLEAMHEGDSFDLDKEAFADLPIMMRLENELLLEALQQLGERERYVLLTRSLEDKSFESLSEELGLTYKGVAAIYYRAIQKIKKRMMGEQNEFF